MTNTRGVEADAASAGAPSLPFLVGTMLAAQSFGTMATMTLPVVAPKVAETYGISSSLIGYQISILAGAMLVSLALGSQLSMRWGACRVQQGALLLLVAGSFVAILPDAAFMFGSALALGLGYGLLTPSASHLLARFAPAKRRNLIFSLKQTGVPLGGVGAAAITPAVAVVFGWQWALVGNALVLCGLVLLLQRGRPHWDNDCDPAARIGVNPFASVAEIWQHDGLRLLSIAGGCFVIVQICLSTFTVVFFAEEVGIGLIEAGIVLTASQVGGVAGRVFWGWMADVTRSCFGVLAVLAAVMLAACLLAYFITAGWSILAACALFFVIGSTASGWNGAFLGEVARVTPRPAVSRMTGGSLVYVNVFKMLGPIVFTNIYLASGSYALTFALLAVPTGAGLACVLAARQGELRAAAVAAR
ncbi:MAG: MFS transporter [Betaproteobacteria bacterium]|nr:MFS transporter [Betaproteobacteria bacterium]MDH3436141.1 MFS transporter [Betaproteobacteria bacterium]